MKHGNHRARGQSSDPASVVASRQDASRSAGKQSRDSCYRRIRATSKQSVGPKMDGAYSQHSCALGAWGNGRMAQARGRLDRDSQTTTPKLQNARAFGSINASKDDLFTRLRLWTSLQMLACWFGGGGECLFWEWSGDTSCKRPQFVTRRLRG